MSFWLSGGGTGQGEPARADPTYLAELVSGARAQQLARSREWQVLLHYRERRFGGVASEADGPGFFLAPNGKWDPDAEIEATLAAFFSAPPDDPAAQHPQCRFIARYHWLKAHLGFDPTRLPQEDCSRFREWISALDPESVTLIFPSAYLNNPSSMFGHTLLRIDHTGRTDNNRLLDYTINFAADTNTPTALRSIVLGLTGGLPGRFSITPYYVKTRNYTDIESRDIWEYRLAFTPEQVETLLQHAWEMGTTYFDYFFFDENCSYHLLSLLDAADPTLHLTDRFTWWTIPTDTIRAVLDAPGLVTRVTFRPARSTELTHHRSLLRADEDRWLFRVLQEPSRLRSSAFKELPEERRALIIDVATEYLAYRKYDDDPDDADRTTAVRHQLLLERATLRAAGVHPPPAPPPPPEGGHDTARIGVAGGRTAGEWFGQISLRPALHDLLGDETGYTANTSLEFSNVVIRYDAAHRLALKRLDVVSILSLSPLDRLIRKPSWQIAFGVDAVDDLPFLHRSALGLEIGAGVAAQSHWWRREVWYVLAETAAQYGQVLDEKHRAGLGGTVGLLVDLTSRWRTHLFGTYRTFPLGHRSSDLVTNLQARYTLSKNWDARMEWSRRPDRSETVIGINTYF